MSRYLALVVFALALGCGSGTGPNQAIQGTKNTLEWDAPTQMMDNATNCDPYRDIDHYELYASPDNTFGDNSLSIAEIAGTYPFTTPDGLVGREITESFSLISIAPYLPVIDNVDQYRFLSMKSVGTDGEKSNYSPAIEWRR